MRLSVFQISLLLAAQCSSFVLQPTKYTPINNGRVDSMLHAVELSPEPEGGEEMEAVNTMEGSRMKNMGEVEGVTNDDGTVYKYWLTAVAVGSLVDDLYKKVMKDASRKANFPGFRKGQVPPYALPQIRTFAVQEGIIQTCQAAVEAYGLKSIPGSDGEVEVHEDIAEVAKGYKLGDDITFTATLNAISMKGEETEEALVGASEDDSEE